MARLALRRIGVASNASRALPTLGECIELLLEQGDGLAAEVLDALKAPVDKASRARNPSVDPVIGAAVRQLGADSVAVRATFCAELRRLVYHGGGQDPQRASLGRIDDIHVFDLSVLEAQIEQALAQQEVTRAVDDVLPLFHALVSALLGWSTVQPTLNPLKPEAFLGALCNTLAQWIPDEQLRAVLLRPSAIALGIGLRQLYRESCEWLRSQGVEPVQQVDPRSPVRRPADGAVQGDLNKTIETLDKLRRLLGAEPLTASEGGLRDFIHTIPASLVALQDLRLVEPMIQRLSERSAQGTAPSRPSTLVRPPAGGARSREQNQRVGRQLAEEVVGMMLEQVVEDERLLGTVRLQLRALEAVLVRLALSDPRFFIDREHPARQLLDRIVQRSLGVDQRDQDGIYGFTACVSNAVGALLRSQGDAAAFLHALEVLERHLYELEETRRKQREFERAEREHAEKRAVLAKRFAQALRVRYHDLELPPFVAEFLRGPWSEVLAEAHLRSGGVGSDPRGFRAVMDDLVWSVQPHADPRDFARLVRLVPRLLARLNEGLVLIRHPRALLTEFLDGLSAVHDESLERHRRALAAGRAAVEALSSQAAALEAAAEPGEEAPVTLDPRGPGAVERRSRPRRAEPSAPAGGPRELQVGNWVDLQLGGRWVRAELTWVSPNRSLFMFTSGAGLAHAMSRRTMDRLQAHGRLRLGTAPEAIDLVLDTAHGVLSGRDPNAD